VGFILSLRADGSRLSREGGDGLNSLVRRTFEKQFEPTLDYFSNHFAWFGTERPFDTLTQTFVRTEKGALNAHHYRYSPAHSTFIVECDAPTFAAYGFAGMDEAHSAQVCASIFAEALNGAALITNKSMWRQFPRLWCNHWVAGRQVLLGDAAHTAHFSIGSGTRLAMEDAIALVRALADYDNVGEALVVYQQTRQPVAKKIVDAANTSAAWYESFAEKMALAPLDFAFDYITRSGRVDRQRLRRLAPGFMARYEAERAGNEPARYSEQ
jgi:2-polyprenyl-6-methoxyphenol hydroxylase-like FAD-dependent oxidoreductase